MTRPSSLSLPGPRGLPWVGNLLDMRRDPMAFYEDVARRYGGVARVRLGGYDIALVSSPEGFRDVLLRDVDGWERGFGSEVLVALVGHGLLMAEGDAWRAQRKLVHPVFQRERIDGLAPLVRRLTDDALGAWEPAARAGATVDLHDRLRDLTLRIASVGLVGTDVFEQTPTLRGLLERLWVHTGERLRWSPGLYDRLPLAAHARFQRDLATLDEAIARAVKAHAPRANDDLLRVLLDARGKDGNALNPRQIRDEVVTFLLAGQECTSIALAWTLHLLGRNPEVARALAEQVRALDDDALDATAHRKAPLLRPVIREAMRLYPPSWMFSRQSLGEETVAGHKLPKSAVVFLCTWALHRDPTLWPDPLRFDPSRFANEAPARDRFAFLPFGVGPRMCVGMSLAMMQAEVILAMLLRRYRVECLRPEIQPDPGLTLRPRGGVPARLTLR